MTATLTSPPRRGAARNPGGTSPWERARLRPPLPPRPSALPTIVGRNGPVVALHQRDVIAPGGIADQAVVDGDRMVAARDLAGDQWWLPAAAVWVDAEAETRPDHPRPAGLATGRDRVAAITAGLSDRLGWEAVLEFDRGRELGLAPGMNAPERLVVLDGRVGHEVPTVVTLGDDIVRWGAGATWSQALDRAVFGHDAVNASVDELSQVSERLGRDGLTIATVDLATPLLARAGVFRTSVQLMVATPWDGGGTRVR